MKKVISILIIIILSMITGCSEEEIIKHNYIYKGENELWIAEYKVNGTGTFTKKNGKNEYDSNSDSKLTVTYKKDISELSSVKQLQISYKSSAGDGNLSLDFNGDPLKEKTFTIKSGSTGGAIENKDEIIKVNITVDGRTQTLDLKNMN